MAISSRNKVSVAFSMSGMTDVVFLLLIFFMLTSTLIVDNALRLSLPQSTNQLKENNPVIIVWITKDLEFYIDKTKVDYDDLEPLLQKKLSFRIEPTISLYADKSVPLEYVVKVMNIAKNNKYKLILATSPED